MKKIESKDKTKYDNFYSSLNAEIFINESDTENTFKSIFITIISNIQKLFGKGSIWIIDSVIDDTISILKYNHLAGSSYTKLPKELNHPGKDLINIQSTGHNECFKRCLVRYLNPAEHNPGRIAKADEDFAKRLGFKDIKVPVKTRGIDKIEKKISISIIAFGYENKVKYPIYVIKKML